MKKEYKDGLYIRCAKFSDIAQIVNLVNFSYRSKVHQGWTTEADIVEGD